MLPERQTTINEDAKHSAPDRDDSPLDRLLKMIAKEVAKSLRNGSRESSISDDQIKPTADTHFDH